MDHGDAHPTLACSSAHVGRWQQVGRRSEESDVGLGRLLRVSRQSVLRGGTLGKQLIIRNGREAKSFW